MQMSVFIRSYGQLQMMIKRGDACYQSMWSLIVSTYWMSLIDVSLDDMSTTCFILFIRKDAIELVKTFSILIPLCWL